MKNKINNEKVLYVISKLDDSKRNQIIFLSLLVISALAVRLYIFPFDVPFFNDSQDYFWYAIDTSLLNKFPEGHNLTNNGWPVFVSVFFLGWGGRGEFTSRLDFLILDFSIFSMALPLNTACVI